MRKIVKAVSQVWGESCESQHICPLRTGLGGYPAWIRTKNNASKGRCVTVTPRGTLKADFRLAILDQTAIGKMPHELAFEPRITPKPSRLCYHYSTGYAGLRF